MTTSADDIMVSVDELARRRALDSYRLLDTLPEPAFNDIVNLASTICGVPIALVSLIDRERQWFKARVGMELTETDRNIAFCDHAIRQPKQLMEVPDARTDPRFALNPLVTGDGGIQFYAGMPLVTPAGSAIGTICVLDRKPRELTATQRDALGALARLTMNLMEGRQLEQELERTAMLAEAAASPPASLSSNRSVVLIVQLRDYAGAMATIGEYAVEKVMKKLEQMLDGPLRHALGDSVNRVTDGTDVIVVLHGDDTDEVLQALQDVLAAFESETDLQVISASAESAPDGESIPKVYLRADEELSRLKDELVAAVQGSEEPSE